MRRIVALAAAAAFSAVLPHAASAQQFSFGMGGVESREPEARAIGWSFAYAHGLAGPLFAKTVYLNEGHVPGHHRDGVAAQLGLLVPTGIEELTASVAAGPYRYFDTEVAENATGYANSHGWAGLYSAALTWSPRGKVLFYQLRVDRVQGADPPNMTLLLANIGWRLDNDQDRSFAPGSAPRWKGGRGELDVYAGRTIVNSFASEQSTAYSAEYRHDFNSVVRGSVGWLHEGDARLIRRDGVIAQAWLEPTFVDGLFSTGVGFGPYVALDAYRGDSHHTLGLLSLTASWRFARGWVARVTWHRSVSDDDRDSDVILLGAGYRF
jgi:hypothetical protein